MKQRFLGFLFFLGAGVSAQLNASGMGGGFHNLDIPWLGVSLASSTQFTRPIEPTAEISAAFKYSSIGLLGWHATGDVGYDFRNTTATARGLAGLGIVIAYIDVGYHHSFEHDESHILLGGSGFQLLSFGDTELGTMMELFAHYGFATRSTVRDTVTLGVRFLSPLAD